MQSFIEMLAENLPGFGSWYNLGVEIVNFAPQGYNQIAASGECPHCAHRSFFKPVTSPYFENSGASQISCIGAQCEACKSFVLVLGTRAANTGGQQPWNLKAVYPLGRPNDSVDASVPDAIAVDFKEALRCRWVDAYKATVTMCRRAIQASCLAQGASKRKKLTAQIDQLASKGLITTPLKDFAHEVRLEGNDGAHPEPDGLDRVGPKDADDIIQFTREYLHHVYVMPALLAARKTAAAATP
jgi:uncharacterized protein DUF4145